MTTVFSCLDPKTRAQYHRWLKMGMVFLAYVLIFFFMVFGTILFAIVIPLHALYNFIFEHTLNSSAHNASDSTLTENNCKKGIGHVWITWVAHMKRSLVIRCFSIVVHYSTDDCLVKGCYPSTADVVQCLF